MVWLRRKRRRQHRNWSRRQAPSYFWRKPHLFLPLPSQLDVPALLHVELCRSPKRPPRPRRQHARQLAFRFIFPRRSTLGQPRTRALLYHTKPSTQHLLYVAAIIGAHWTHFPLPQNAKRRLYSHTFFLVYGLGYCRLPQSKTLRAKRARLRLCRFVLLFCHVDWHRCLCHF